MAQDQEHFIHSLKDLCSELDRKIEKLTEMRDKVQDRLSRNIGVPKNSEALDRISKSLQYAIDARKAMGLSCCDQGCNIEWQDR